MEHCKTHNIEILGYFISYFTKLLISTSIFVWVEWMSRNHWVTYHIEIRNQQSKKEILGNSYNQIENKVTGIAIGTSCNQFPIQSIKPSFELLDPD